MRYSQSTPSMVCNYYSIIAGQPILILNLNPWTGGDGSINNVYVETGGSGGVPSYTFINGNTNLDILTNFNGNDSFASPEAYYSNTGSSSDLQIMICPTNDSNGGGSGEIIPGSFTSSGSGSQIYLSNTNGSCGDSHTYSMGIGSLEVLSHGGGSNGDATGSGSGGASGYSSILNGYGTDGAVLAYFT